MSKSNLADMSEIIQGLAGKEMDGTDLPEHAPTGTVRSKHEVLIVVSDILSTGVRRSAREVCVVGLQELGCHGRRGNHHDVDEAKPEVHERPVGAGQGRQGVVRHGPHVGQISNDRPWLWPRGKGEAVAAVVGEPVKEVIEEDRYD